VLLYLTAFFLPATVFGLPLRVRALVLVRWPLTGRPCKASWSLVRPGHVAALQAAFIHCRLHVDARLVAGTVKVHMVTGLAVCSALGTTGKWLATHHDVAAAPVAANVFQPLDVLVDHALLQHEGKKTWSAPFMRPGCDLGGGADLQRNVHQSLSA
jgi:hypothetical protein